MKMGMFACKCACSGFCIVPVNKEILLWDQFASVVYVTRWESLVKNACVARCLE